MSFSWDAFFKKVTTTITKSLILPCQVVVSFVSTHLQGLSENTGLALCTLKNGPFL